MTTKEMIEVMQAYVDGKQIESRQVFPDADFSWQDEPSPCWNWVGFEYRVKSENSGPKWRSYNDTAEMIDDWKERFGAKNWPSHSMPLIWVKNRNDSNYLITGYFDDAVGMFSRCETLTDLFEDYTYLDGSPCGKEVTE